MHRVRYAAPFERFTQWYELAKAAQPKDPDAASLATVDEDGMPSVRIVLVRQVDERGFAFFTNGESRKGKALRQHGKAALCFYWPALDKQVRVEGLVAPIDAAESDAYFQARPRLSQLGAWASHQSQPLSSRDELLDRLKSYDVQYAGTVPRPPHWTGFRISPHRIEFWQAGEFRLHERESYTRLNDGWTIAALNP